MKKERASTRSLLYQNERKHSYCEIFWHKTHDGQIECFFIPWEYWQRDANPSFRADGFPTIRRQNISLLKNRERDRKCKYCIVVIFYMLHFSYVYLLSVYTVRQYFIHTSKCKLYKPSAHSCHSPSHNTVHISFCTSNVDNESQLVIKLLADTVDVIDIGTDLDSDVMDCRASWSVFLERLSWGWYTFILALVSR